MTEIARPRRGHIGSALGRLAARIGQLQQQLSDHLFAEGDAFAREHGWTIAKTGGRFGCGSRVYRDPRFDDRKAQNRLQEGGWLEPPESPSAASAPLPLRKGADS
jgi:hypothetical protein